MKTVKFKKTDETKVVTDTQARLYAEKIDFIYTDEEETENSKDENLEEK
jgi:hypothetical protein